MTVVVADTSPLNYLVLIGEIAILPQLYGHVDIPSEVLSELTDEKAPLEVSRWAESRPGWLHVRDARVKHFDAILNQLDPGERAAILLAQQETDVLLLIDDAAGRSEATRRGIPNTGTLGILRAAGIRRLVDLPASLARLSATNFRIAPALLDELLAEDAVRKHGNT